jgi:molybdate transport system ATP-binding protein
MTAALDATIKLTRGSFSVDLALNVARGEVLALLGPNGAGKTTTLQVLAGLLAVDEGGVTIEGDVADDAAHDVFVPPERRSVGVVFQDYLLFPHLKAVDNVGFGLRARGVSRSAARSAAREWLERVGLAHKASARPRELSGGEAQRVALARALAIEPALLLLDEPLAALDVQTRAEVRGVVREVLGTRRDHGQVIVTHDPVDALTLADRIAIMQDGRIVQCDAPTDIVARPRSAYVADLVGVNLYRGEAEGDVVAVARDQRVVVGEPHRGRVLVVVPPHAVVLHRTRPDGSARNVWRGRVDRLDRLGSRVRVHIAGELPIVAEVTPASIAALDLREGSDVWAAVKATELEVFPE